MLSRDRMSTIYEAAEACRKNESDNPAEIVRLFADFSPEDFSYLCRCLDTYPWPIAIRKRVTQEFAGHLGKLDIEYLCEILEFPWIGVTGNLSPVQVVLEIALHHGFLSLDSKHRLLPALRDYLERFPESAAQEFFHLQEFSADIAEELWHELSIAVQDEIAFTHRRRAVSWQLDYQLHMVTKQRIFDWRKRPTLDIAELLNLESAIRPLLQAGYPRSQPGELLIAALTLDEFERALPPLRPWVDAQCPPFLLDSVIDPSSRLVATVSDFDRGKTARSVEPPVKRPDLGELAERLRDKERFAPWRHASSLERLTPSELAYFCGALDQYPRFVDTQALTWSQYALFVLDLDLGYLLQMLDTPWPLASSEFGVLRTIYQIALSTRLLTVPRRPELAWAFTDFLNKHVEVAGAAAEEFLSLLEVCSFTFAADIWARLKEEVRAQVTPRFRQRLGRRLEGHLDQPESLFLGIEIWESIQSTLESDDAPPEARQAAALLAHSYRELNERTHVDAGELFGLLSVLMPGRPEGPEDRLEPTRDVAPTPAYIARHPISESFARGAVLLFALESMATWVSGAFGRAFSPNPVYVGVSVPVAVAPGTDFVARLYAFVEEFQSKVEEIVQSLAPTNKNVAGLRRCRWRVGEIVTVRTAGMHLHCDPPSFQFEWTGAYEIIDFHCKSDPNTARQIAILAFTVEVAGVVVASIRMEIPIHDKPPAAVRSLRTEAARTGFASYAVQDRPEVLGRVSSIEQSAGMLVFVDCLDLHPGEEWMPILENEITSRDTFLLFWSGHADRSKWVTWEWRTALAKRGTDRMEIHPLQGPSEAPPPKELAHLNFGDRYLTVRGASRLGDSRTAEA